jgi:hypothetical protein
VHGSSESAPIFIPPVDLVVPTGPCRQAERRAASAVVLGATIAIGSCALAACESEAEAASKMPALAPIAAHEEVEEDESIDMTAEQGRVETFEASPGFTPDPLVRQGTTAGGSIDANEIDERCHGWISSTPDFVLEAHRPFAELAVMIASREDTTLLIVGPDGDPRCANDDDGSHPIVRGVFEPGLHRVWIGTAERGATEPYLLGLSELDDSQPSALLH